MFKIQEIREIIKLVDQSSINTLEIKEGDSKISIQRNAGSALVVGQEVKSVETQAKQVVSEAPSVLTTAVDKGISNAHVQVATAKEIIEEVYSTPKMDLNENLSKIVSPMVGTFYRAPGMDAAPFVKIGEKVEKSTVVCILEAMKLFNEIEAEMDGEIVDILVENGQLVEYGQPLFLIKHTS
ncbi:acetyl-CoA carboxylase biotin carboxyl carrier protein [Neobacillus massiliamazoniensis]|uniref:Biotin carboxyl carrier protein of acetyl-CoA carboxylase n=1 Tax=Neobacillus massiliamazoniensis TaxID=1499688 RepID=A0A0U1NYQ6_9BACI|nr:acetyl-CoA carboxylase biotin carboxyl carrier protein [Neobacillus massiliamazoniensis]CRK82978.1 acetyl-CoA carboxylase biotin carboxyl carrier protein subunit [Neobacillus massiliamazoniensis]